jgi:hypothetical protein
MPTTGLGCSSVVQRLPSMREALGLILAQKKRKDKKKTSPLKCQQLSFIFLMKPQFGQG